MNILNAVAKRIRLNWLAYQLVQAEHNALVEALVIEHAAAQQLEYSEHAAALRMELLHLRCNEPNPTEGKRHAVHADDRQFP